MEYFAIGTFEEINKYIPIDTPIYDVIASKDNDGFYIQLITPDIRKQLLKEHPYLEQYVSTCGMGFKIMKYWTNTFGIVQILKRSQNPYAFVYLNHKSEDFLYTNVMCALLDNPYEVKEFLRHIYINDRTLFIKGEHDINIEDYLDAYVLKSISKLCIHQFMANFYAFNSKNLTSKMYVQKDLRYNISIDTTYNVCSPDDKRLKSFEDLSEAIKYLMFVTFSDRDAYNKYIELYPNFLKGN